MNECEYTLETKPFPHWVSGCNQSGSFDNPPLNAWCGPKREAWEYCPWCGAKLVIAKEDLEA